MEGERRELPDVEVISQVCHAANTAYCVAIGDPVLPLWADLDEGYRASTRAGVRFALTRSTTPAEQHEAWCQERLAQGWQYGASLDRAAKIHPALVDYDQLPLAQQRKDALFRAIVHALS